MFYIGLYRVQHEKIFLSETTRPRALSFCMKYHLVNLYQFCSNYSPGAKNGPASGVTEFGVFFYCRFFLFLFLKFRFSRLFTFPLSFYI